jgi:hypothetical protein
MIQNNSNELKIDDLPEMVQTLSEQLNYIQDKVDTLSSVQRRNEEPITTAELCQRLKITEQTAIAWRKADKIPYMRLDGIIRYNWEDIVHVLENR